MAVTMDQLYRWACHHMGAEPVAVGAPANVSPVAAKLADAFQYAAPLILALHPWNFCRRVAQLSLADIDADPWDYVFTKPSAARINWISPTGRDHDRLTSGWDDRGGYIYSDQGTLWADYNQADFATEAKLGYWPAPPARVLASAMADLTSKPVTNSRATQLDLSSRTNDLMDQATTWDALQSPPMRRRPGRWNRSRRGYTRLGDER